MTARGVESALLARCAAVARGGAPGACDQCEANVFRLAAMVLQSRFPRESERLICRRATRISQRIPMNDWPLPTWSGADGLPVCRACATC